MGYIPYIQPLAAGNTKSECRNSKQARVAGAAGPQRAEGGVSAIGSFGFWVCFAFRISNREGGSRGGGRSAKRAGGAATGGGAWCRRRTGSARCGRFCRLIPVGTPRRLPRRTGEGSRLNADRWDCLATCRRSRPRPPCLSVLGGSRRMGDEGPQSASKTESEAFNVVRCFVPSGTDSRLDKKKKKIEGSPVDNPT